MNCQPDRFLTVPGSGIFLSETTPHRCVHSIAAAKKPDFSSPYKIFGQCDENKARDPIVPAQLRENLARRIAICPNLGFQRIKTVEFFFVANKFDERGLNLAPIKIAGKIKQMNFQ